MCYVVCEKTFEIPCSLQRCTKPGNLFWQGSDRRVSPIIFRHEIYPGWIPDNNAPDGSKCRQVGIQTITERSDIDSIIPIQYRGSKQTIKGGLFSFKLHQNLKLPCQLSTRPRTSMEVDEKIMIQRVTGLYIIKKGIPQQEFLLVGSLTSPPQVITLGYQVIS